MSNEYTAPINHGTGSAVATTGLEAAKGGVKGVLAGLLGAPFMGMLGGAALAAIPVLAIGAPIALGALAFGASLAGIATTLAYAVGGFAALGGVLGLAGGTFGWLGVAGLSGGIGLVRGIGKGIGRVGQEQGRFNEINAPVQAYKAQARIVEAQARPAEGDKYNFPPQGSAMNSAMPNVETNTVQNQGRAMDTRGLAY